MCLSLEYNLLNHLFSLNLMLTRRFWMILNQNEASILDLQSHCLIKAMVIRLLNRLSQFSFNH